MTYLVNIKRTNQEVILSDRVETTKFLLKNHLKIDDVIIVDGNDDYALSYFYDDITGSIYDDLKKEALR